MKKRSITVAVEFKNGSNNGQVVVKNGKLSALKLIEGRGQVTKDTFSISSPGPARLAITVSNANVETGSHSAIVTVLAVTQSFSFFLRDVNSATPIYIPEYEVAVTGIDDSRNYNELEQSVRDRKLFSEFDRYALEAEESYEQACSRNLDQYCPTWLGLSRDMRIFRVGYHERFGYWGEITPCYHSTFHASSTKASDPNYKLSFHLGPGSSCRHERSRKLEDGVLPILHSTQQENDVSYNLTLFATLENEPLQADNIVGTDWQAAYLNTGGNMISRYKQGKENSLSAEEKQQLEEINRTEMYEREQEVICCVRISIVNSGKVPRYAWLKAPRIEVLPKLSFNEQNGFSCTEDGKVFCVNRLNGKSLPNEEMAILLQPGETALLELLIPHQPISVARARKLFRLNLDQHLTGCREYWRNKLNSAAKFTIPEATIDEAVKAGLLHCDIAAIGREPDEPVLATIGWYAPIGSESSPIIQFFDSAGWHKLAERCIDFFLKRQREDGFIQNFAGYQLETGPLLWTMGEHYRYTRDLKWVKRVKDNILRACDFLLQWRERNKKEEYHPLGYYGMIEGKVADPNDFYHSFMLNGLSYLGLIRAAEMLREIDLPASERIFKEASLYREDIRNGFYFALGQAPVVPIGDGSWTPMSPPWVEAQGDTSLYADGGNWFTHGSFVSRGSLIGSLYLVISEVLDPEEVGSTFLLKANQQPITKENAGLSQPYYCRHDFLHLKRNETNEFLKLYYHQLSALHDRETYSFWEHYYHASQHKTHEEGWFLMQTRWMLYLETENTLQLLKVVPRKWLENGKNISVEDAATYFGQLSFAVVSKLLENVICATVRCTGDRQPAVVTIRLPHPEHKAAVSCTGGTYDAETETVTIADFRDEAEVILHYQ